MFVLCWVFYIVVLLWFGVGVILLVSVCMLDGLLVVFWLNMVLVGGSLMMIVILLLGIELMMSVLFSVMVCCFIFSKL